MRSINVFALQLPVEDMGKLFNTIEIQLHNKIRLLQIIVNRRWVNRKSCISDGQFLLWSPGRSKFLISRAGNQGECRWGRGICQKYLRYLRLTAAVTLIQMTSRKRKLLENFKRIFFCRIKQLLCLFRMEKKKQKQAPSSQETETHEVQRSSLNDKLS